MTGAAVLPPGRFFGAVDDGWHTALVKLSVVRHAEPRCVPPHSHEHMFLCLLLQGGYREWVDEHELVYRPLTMVFHPEQLSHRDEITAPGTTFFTIEVSPALLGARERRRAGLRSVRDLSGGSRPAGSSPPSGSRSRPPPSRADSATRATCRGCSRR